VIVVLLSLAPVVLISTPAAAEVAGTIVNYNSGRCLGVTASGFADGVWANQWGCAGASSQSWTLQQVGTDTFRIINDNSGRCLDVMGGTGALADGIHIHEFLCLSVAQTNQLWRFEDMGPYAGSTRWYRIKAVHSGRCLSVDSSYTGDMNSPNGSPNPPGLGMNQWGCIPVPGGPFGAHTAQLWRLNKPPTRTATCTLQSHVQRLQLQPTSGAADAMSSAVRKTVFAFPSCASSAFIAHPGAHLGLGSNGTSGLVEVGFRTTQEADGAQSDGIFSEIMFASNVYSSQTKDNPLYANMVLHGTVCGRYPSNDTTVGFTLQLYLGRWYTWTSCQSWPLWNFDPGGSFIGKPAVEFELYNNEGVRAGGGKFAEQWSMTYRGAGNITETPIGFACQSGVPNMTTSWNGSTWTISEGTGQSC
jgi:Ricin-type beta-trefoil lectin domain-like